MRGADPRALIVEDLSGPLDTSARDAAAQSAGGRQSHVAYSTQGGEATSTEALSATKYQCDQNPNSAAPRILYIASQRSPGRNHIQDLEHKGHPAEVPAAVDVLPAG